MKPRQQQRSKKPKAGPYSIRELARRLSVHASTVTDALDRDRLAACVVMVNGERKIRDLDVAVAEWHASKRLKVDGAPDDDMTSIDMEYKRDRARRERALADIAETEARRLSGGEWLPASHFTELKEQFLEKSRTWVRMLRQRIPTKIMHRCDVAGLARAAHAKALADHRRPNGCRGVDGGPLLPVVNLGFAMDELQNAVDDALNEIADELTKPTSDESEAEP